MGNQKQAVMDLVERHRGEGRTLIEELGSLGVARSSYYRWKKGAGEKNRAAAKFVSANRGGARAD